MLVVAIALVMPAVLLAEAPNARALDVRSGPDASRKPRYLDSLGGPGQPTAPLDPKTVYDLYTSEWRGINKAEIRRVAPEDAARFERAMAALESWVLARKRLQSLRDRAQDLDSVSRAQLRAEITQVATRCIRHWKDTGTVHIPDKAFVSSVRAWSFPRKALSRAELPSYLNDEELALEAWSHQQLPPGPQALIWRFIQVQKL